MLKAAVPAGEPPLEELVIERIIECLETAAFEGLKLRKARDSVLGIEFDEDTVCNVCQQVFALAFEPRA